MLRRPKHSMIEIVAPEEEDMLTAVSDRIRKEGMK